MTQLLKFFSLFLLASSSHQLSQKCFNTFANLVHPYHCCQYPIADTQNTTADHCYHSCFLNPDMCCLYDCMFREMQHFNNGKFSSEERVKYYGVDIDNKKIPRDLWLPVVEKSIAECEKTVEIKLRDKEPCKMPEFMFAMFACEHYENFINCPTFANTSHCVELRKFVENIDDCTITYKDKKYPQQEFWFVEEIYEEGDNFECLVKQLW